MDIEEILGTVIRSVGDTSLENDKALLTLCQAIVTKVNLMEEFISEQSLMIDTLQTQLLKLYERHEALLHAFYSHCQEGASNLDEEVN